jgi:hypothetical protein
MLVGYRRNKITGSRLGNFDMLRLGMQDNLVRLCLRADRDLEVIVSFSFPDYEFETQKTTRAPV